ncbi:Phosphatidylinositol 4-phosphate 5-kinase 8 [Diplonema papillatum]|nr:Phosphatidylinositol 4-phosphate 5-kinase 8 [Diplonema papillatum]
MAMNLSVRKTAFSLAKDQLGAEPSGCVADPLGMSTTMLGRSEKEGRLEWRVSDQRVYQYEGGVKAVRKDAYSGVDPTNHVRNSQGEPYAKYTYPNGDFFEGDWKMGKRCGHGVLRMTNGYRYEGEWVDDAPTGAGGEIFTHNEYVKCEHYQHGKPQKNGILFYKPREDARYRYQGGFKNGKRHGKGTIYYGNGDTFRGHFKDGKREGKGLTSQANGRKFASLWRADRLVSGPDEAFGEGAAESDTDDSPQRDMVEGPSSAYAAADLTKWKIQDTTDLTCEHFHRINAWFENLDNDYSGLLSMTELRTVWGKDQQMLRRLDRDKDGRVSLYEVLVEWYPHVRKSQLQRFVQLEPNLAFVHRARGVLAGVLHPAQDGFIHVAGAEEAGLTKERLESCKQTLAGERFSLPMWQRAKALKDPPGLVEILEGFHPNTPRAVLERVSLCRLSYGELEECLEAFSKYDVHRTGHLDIDLFTEARARKRAMQAGSTTVQGRMPQGPVAALSDMAVPYFFKSDPCWPIGRYIRLTVAMLEAANEWISKLPTRRVSAAGQVTFGELMRHAFPNLPCAFMQEYLGKKKSQLPTVCTCSVCAFCRTRRVP